LVIKKTSSFKVVVLLEKKLISVVLKNSYLLYAKFNNLSKYFNVFSCESLLFLKEKYLVDNIEHSLIKESANFASIPIKPIPIKSIRIYLSLSERSSSFQTILLNSWYH
jgi:hypothetical protein